MKRLTLKRPEYSILAVLAIVLMLGYQNCSNSMSFDGSGAMAGKIDNVSGVPDVGGDPLPNIGDGGGGTNPGTPGMTPAPGTTDPSVMLPPKEGDDDTNIDYDHENHRVAFSCTTGATLPFNEDELKKADDLVLRNAASALFYYSRPLRNVDVVNLKGSIGIKNALNLNSFANVQGMVAFARAVNIHEMDNVHAGVVSASGVRMGGMHNIHSAYICASGNSIDSISNLHGMFMKFRGRSSGTGAAAVNGKALEISNIHSDFTSIYQLDVKRIVNVDGELIIRDSVIDSIDNLGGGPGGITLINSRVKSLTNAKGVLRLKNSTVDSESNTNLTRVTLP